MRPGSQSSDPKATPDDQQENPAFRDKMLPDRLSMEPATFRECEVTSDRAGQEVA